jgi:hypothetical protein
VNAIRRAAKARNAKAFRLSLAHELSVCPGCEFEIGGTIMEDPTLSEQEIVWIALQLEPFDPHVGDLEYRVGVAIKAFAANAPRLFRVK